MCGVEPVQAHTPCTDNGGTFCDGSGQCVACLADDDCANITPSSCEGSLFTDSPTCEGGTCKFGMKTDCAATMQACKPDGCVDCVGDADCGPPTGDCELNQCKAGLCLKVPIPQGGPCSQAGGNTCNASGTCIAARYVFVTSVPIVANLNGTMGADAKCQGIATMKKLGGMWASWTSSSMSSASARLMPATAAPYLLLDDTMVAHDWAELTSGTLLHGIDLDENKAPVPQSQIDVWTGTKPDGTYAGGSCGDWGVSSPTTTSAVVGRAGQKTSEWTMKNGTCSLMARLYCFQQ